MISVSINLFVPNIDNAGFQLFSYCRRETAYFMHILRAYLHEYTMKIRFFSANTAHWLRKKSSKVLNPPAEGFKPSTGTF